MSTSGPSYLTVISQQITIYAGIPIFFAGIIGSLLNTIVFLSLKTFRESSCAFYLAMMAIVNIGQLGTSLFGRIMISGFNIDWTASSTPYCKFRSFCATVSTVMSFTCMCLATIDQWLATCSNPRWRFWSNVKIAHRVVIIFIIIWVSHGILYLIYYDRVESPTTGKLVCMSSNEIFATYHTKVFTAVFIGFLPIFLNTLFGSLAYYNIQHLAYRTVPLVRRELDKQITTMALTQTLFVFFAASPYVIVAILNSNANITQDPIVADRFQFANVLTLCIYYLNFAVSNRKNAKFLFYYLYNFRVHFM